MRTRASTETNQYFLEKYLKPTTAFILVLALLLPLSWGFHLADSPISYYDLGNWSATHPANKTVDSNLSSYGVNNGAQIANLYSNWSVSTDSSEVKVLLDGSENVTAPSVCRRSNNNFWLRVLSTPADNSVNLYCWNTTTNGWGRIYNGDPDTGRVYELDMYYRGDVPFLEYYPLNDSTGSSHLLSFTGLHDGVVNGSLTRVFDGESYGQFFNGSQLVRINESRDDFDIKGNDFTVCFRGNTTDSGFSILVDNFEGDGYDIGQYSNDTIRCRWNDVDTVSLYSSEVFDDGEMRVVCCRKTGNAYALFWDGVKDVEVVQDIGTGIASTAESVTFGAEHDNQYYFGGVLWELVFFNYSLSDSVIAEFGGESISDVLFFVNDSDTPSGGFNASGIFDGVSCPADSTQQILFFGFMFVIIVTLTVLNFLFVKLPVLDLAGGFAFFFYSFTLIGCHFALFLFGVFFSVGLMYVAYDRALK